MGKRVHVRLLSDFVVSMSGTTGTDTLQEQYSGRTPKVEHTVKIEQVLKLLNHRNSLVLQAYSSHFSPERSVRPGMSEPGHESSHSRYIASENYGFIVLLALLVVIACLLWMWRKADADLALLLHRAPATSRTKSIGLQGHLQAVSHMVHLILV